MMTRVFLLLMMVVASTAAKAAQPENGPTVLSQAKVYAIDAEPAHKSMNGSESTNVLRGLLASGESVAVHESMQPVGAEPVALHTIQHSELIVVREGEVMFDHDGKSEKAGPGDVIYVALGTVHRVRNAGSVPAKYVVVAIGGDTKK
jgi:mannose-6-phosphate isomerase-like protein (cupin superfamily)